MSLICELNEIFPQIKPMTLNTMLYDHEHEEMTMYINDFRDDDDPLKQQVEPISTPEEVQNPSYIRWQMFDEILERLYTIECEGYFDKNGNPLEDEESIKHLISGEPPWNIDDDVLERSDENGNFLCYEDYYDYLSRDHNRHDLNKITKKIRPKKFICEAPIGSSKSTAIRKLISSYKTEKFMVIVPTVNIAEEFYTNWMISPFGCVLIIMRLKSFTKLYTMKWIQLLLHCF